MSVLTPVGELATLGIAKESTFNTFAAPTVFHELEAFSPATKNMFIERMGSVAAPGMRPPATGPLDVTGTLRVATVSDICSQLIAYAMGSQSAPASGALTGASVRSSAAVTGTGSPQVVNVTSNPITAGFAVGQTALVYTGAYQEVVTVSAVTSSSLTINPAHTYPGTVAIEQISPTGRISTCTFGNLRQLPSFSMEYNIPVSGGNFGECLDYTGNVIETMKVALASAKGLTIDYTFAGVTPVKQNSPTAASFSTKNIYTMEAAGTTSSLNGAMIGQLTNPPDVKSWDLTLNNQLDKTRRSAGSGRYVNGYPLGQRKVSGTMKLGFESEAARLIFWGGTTGPAAVVPGVALQFVVGSQDTIDSFGTPFLLTFMLPNIRMTQADVPHKTSGGLEQNVTFSAYESVVGAGDDLSVVLQNAQTAIW